MQQVYTYGDVSTAIPKAGADGSRVISFFIFNTQVHFHVYADNGPQAGGACAGDAATVHWLDDALMALRDRCVYFERRLSRTREDSDISRAHKAAPAPVIVAPETTELVRLALDYCARSQGKFDVTMGTLTRLWDFHTGVVPSSLARSRALAHVGTRHVRVGSSSAGAPTLAIDDPATVLDLGGVAKGYIADDLAELLASRGIARFVINLGGNVVVRGGRPAASAHAAGSPWSIGIVNPRDPAHSRAIVALANGSVVTSGAHERRFVRGGVTYHHILDPATGMPAITDVASATIVAPRSIDCDGYSTTAFMLGVQDAIAFIEAIPGVEALIIDERDRVSWTSGLEDRLSLVPTLSL